MKRKRAKMVSRWDTNNKTQFIKAIIAGAIVGLAIVFLL